MKKSLLVLGLSMITFGSFANEIKVDKKEKTDVTACCTMTETRGVQGQAGYTSVTITKCVSASSREAARLAACKNATSAALKTLSFAEDLEVVLSINR